MWTAAVARLKATNRVTVDTNSARQAETTDLTNKIVHYADTLGKFSFEYRLVHQYNFDLLRERGYKITPLEAGNYKIAWD